MNMTLAIVLIVTFIVCYCIADHGQSKKKDDLTALSDRVDALENQLDHVLNIAGQPGSDDTLITGQSHDPND